MPRSLLACLVALLFAGCATQAPVAQTYDIVVYGDSAAAVAAALQAKRQGSSVVLVNTTKFLGGMTCSGLSASDINQREAVGGVARELYGRIADTTARPTWITSSRMSPRRRSTAW